MCFRVRRVDFGGITEKKMLAVVHAHRVHGNAIWKVLTLQAASDHISNTFFQTQPNLYKWQAHWLEFVQRFGVFEWKYCMLKKRVT
jgi:hypothetical protein